MRAEHLSDAELGAYRERELTGDALLEASDHLAECASCRAKLLQLVESQPRDLAAPPPDEQTVSYEELVASLEGGDPLTRREVAAKLLVSRQARAQLADLAAFRSEMNALPVRDFERVPSATQNSSKRTLRWILPLAAAVAVSVGSLWWAVTLRQESASAVMLRDGGRTISISASGRMQGFRDLPAPLQDALAETLRTGKVAVPAEVRALAGQAGVLAGGADERVPLRVIAPIATAVPDGAPHFRWAGIDGATAYKINVAEQTSGDLVASQEVAADQLEWTPAESLPSGQTYEWEVQAFRGGEVIAKSPSPPEPPARFEVLEEGQRAELQEAIRRADDSHLALGIAHARAGVLEEARREFEILANENPNSALVRRLLEQVSVR